MDLFLVVVLWENLLGDRHFVKAFHQLVKLELCHGDSLMSRLLLLLLLGRFR